MEVLNKFGFEPILFLAQIFNFILLFLILKKFLYKPVLKMLDERRQKIEQGLKDAAEADKRLQETIEKESKILKEAQAQARKMLDEAKTTQQQMLRDAEEATQAKVEKMLDEARKQITYEAAQTEKRLTANVSQLAVQFLQQSITDLFGTKEQEIIMKNAVKKLQEKRAD